MAADEGVVTRVALLQGDGDGRRGRVKVVVTVSAAQGAATGGGQSVVSGLAVECDGSATTGQVVGVKAAGGVSTTKAALHMLVLVKETLGDDWLTPDRFRIGASSLLNDLLMQYAKLDGGHYGRAEDFSKE